MSRAQLFIGRLPKDVRRGELEHIFGRYGRVTRCDIRIGMETAYAFIDYDDHRNAKEALRYENGHEFAGQRIVVDWAIDDYKYGRFSKRAATTGYRKTNYPRQGARSRSRSMSPRREERSRRRRTPSRSPSKSRERNGKTSKNQPIIDRTRGSRSKVDRDRDQE